MGESAGHVFLAVAGRVGDMGLLVGLKMKHASTLLLLGRGRTRAAGKRDPGTTLGEGEVGGHEWRGGLDRD